MDIVKKLSVIIVLTTGIISCKQEIKINTVKLSDETLHPKITVTDTVASSHPHPVKKTLQIEKISAKEFHTARQHAKVNKPLEKITDFKTVQQQLSGVVDFKETGDYLGINAIHFRNGISNQNEVDVSECSFVAYFPAEDVLLLECGHTTDVSFNLTTGQSTYAIGNLELIITSPGEKYRLNKVFEGQECYYYFIQEKKNGTFQKVFELDKIFKKQYNQWLCTTEKEFWTDDTTLYFGEIIQYKEDGNEYEYYKIKITDSP